MNKDFKKQVFERIHKKEISMHLKVYFVFRTGVIVLISLLAFLLLAFSLSFVFFSIHESGEQFLLGFGMSGVFTFLRIFPWAIVIFTIVLFFLLEWILRRFKFSYRLPMVYIFLYTLIVTLFTSILFTFTPVHLTFLKKAEMGQLPIIGGFYDAIHDSQQVHGVFRGNITSIQDTTVIISHNDSDKDADDGTWAVIPPYNFNFSKLYIGEKIYIAGKINGNRIYAYGIHELPTNKR